MRSREPFYLAGAGVLGAILMATLPAAAQTDTTGAVAATGQATNQVANTAGSAVGNVAGQIPGTVSAVGNTATNVVGGLQPTLQPVGQGVGSAFNNLTQPDNVSALLEFLSSIVPNHIEAHVNLDALRVEKLTVDVRGVDLRNLKVDLLVANSRNAGVVRPALRNGTNNTTTGSTKPLGTSPTSLQYNGGVNLGIGNGGATTNGVTGTAAVPYTAPTTDTAAQQ